MDFVTSYFFTNEPRFRVQGVESIDGHFATLCREFDFYDVKEKYRYLNYYLSLDSIISYTQGWYQGGVKATVSGVFRTLSLKIQKAGTKIEIVLALPCWLSSWLFS